MVLKEVVLTMKTYRALKCKKKFMSVVVNEPKYSKLDYLSVN